MVQRRASLFIGLAVILLVAVWFSMFCGVGGETTEETRTVTPTPQALDAPQEVIDSVLRYSPAVADADIDYKSSGVYVRVVIEPGTTQTEAEAILDHALGLLNELFNARDHSFDVYVSDTDDDVVVSVHQDPVGIFGD